MNQCLRPFFMKFWTLRASRCGSQWPFPGELHSALLGCPAREEAPWKLAVPLGWLSIRPLGGHLCRCPWISFLSLLDFLSVPSLSQSPLCQALLDLFRLALLDLSLCTTWLPKNCQRLSESHPKYRFLSLGMDASPFFQH